jgi:hypothetical protein
VCSVVCVCMYLCVAQEALQLLVRRE